MKRLFLSCCGIFLDYSNVLLSGVLFADADEAEEGVVDDVHIAALDALGDEGLALVVLDLLDATQLHEDEVDHRADAHLPPGLAIVVVLVEHKLGGAGDVLVVERKGLGKEAPSRLRDPAPAG